MKEKPTMIQPLSEEEYIPVRMLNEYMYCPRLFYMMHVKGLYDESADTITGSAQHQRKRNRAVQEQGNPWPDKIVRSFILSDAENGITGKFDGICETEQEIIAIEDKKSSSPDINSNFSVEGIGLQRGIWDNDQIQLGAQCLLLRANNYNCNKARIYYRGNNKKIDFEFSQVLEKAVLMVVEKARCTAASDVMPEPLIDSDKCIRCSLNELCLPDETLFAKQKIADTRKIIVGRDDAGIIHAVTPGTYITKKSETLVITVPGEEKQIVPIKDVSHVCMNGTCQITTQALLSVIKNGGTVNYISNGGWLNAIVASPLSKNIILRKRQFQKFCQENFPLQLSRNIVYSKILNQRTLLRRNLPRNSKSEKCLRELKNLSKRLGDALSIDTVRGLEGAAANTYWSCYCDALSEHTGFCMSSRNRRPPRDPVNALLSYGYTLLARDFHSAITAVGLDPMFGFYHKIVPGRPALCLDLMEAFRPLIVDSTVLRVINSSILAPEDFIQLEGNCQMKLAAKKKWIEAYENRVDELITHPMFDYRISYRRIFQLETRFLAKVLEGELQDYKPLMTR
jgi:CRISP-associated protein Cas1